MQIVQNWDEPFPAGCPLMIPSEEILFQVKEATWPAARRFQADGWVLRQGQGGGKRVSAASRLDQHADIAAAENHMREMGQPPLFSLKPKDADLDAELAGRGYRKVDPSVFLSADVDRLLSEPVPFLAGSFGDAPLALQREIWAQGGIGPGRLDVMDRITGPKAYILGRAKDRPFGTAFAAIHQGIAMIHAVEVLPEGRRIGVAAGMMRATAAWAQANGAHHITCITTEANTAALSLYAKLGMEPVARYHYRMVDQT